MSRRVVISGLGPISGLGVGVEPTWAAVRDGRSAVAPITAFDPAGFDCRIAAAVPDFKAQQVVPKSYRKAVKVMARDIELAVGAADAAARDARLRTKATDPDAKPEAFVPSYPPDRTGAHIGAGLIAADLDELTDALVTARNEQGQFDIHAWGTRGMQSLTPLWLLKYLPNMLACHVTILHDAQGPSNTITCAEASSGLSVGESLRVIQRGAADLCFCGGTESKLNPMAFLRQQMTGRLNTTDNDRPTDAVRPFCQTAAGTVLGEGGAIVALEAHETFQRRAAEGVTAYAELMGFGAAQSVHPAARNLEPDPQGHGLSVAIRSALREAGVGADQIDLVVSFGLGVPHWDTAEAAALAKVFGQRLGQVAVISTKPLVGNMGAGAGGLDLCVAALALRHQTIPAVTNTRRPIAGLNLQPAPARQANLRYALTYSSSLGGQHAALVLGRLE